MKISEILASHLPANADRNEGRNAAHPLRLYCTESFSEKNEFMDSAGMLTAINEDVAKEIAQLFGKTEVKGSFTINSNRLLHVNGVSFQTLMTIAPPSSLDSLINELLISIRNHYSGFEGIHFSQDGVVFVVLPRKCMNPNSFKLAFDN